jgi:cellulose synthase/poly-beta-1,6-N-acetylglucosamine synthase-like glycosyltransferase
VLLKFNLDDVFVLAFVQLILSTVLVLSPMREIGIRFRSGSRVTEVAGAGIGAIAISAISCAITHALWGYQFGGLELAACPLVFVSLIVAALQPDRTLVGHVFYASFGSAALAFIVWAAYLDVSAPHSFLEVLTSSLVLFLDVTAFIVWMSNINYQADVLSRSRRGRPMPKPDPSYQPFVSLHVPAYNEPPEILIQTIKALEQIDYPNFEVVVVDNNTKDPEVWGPVEEYCRDRPLVKFVHVSPWPGFKAGACNLALNEYTDPRAEIIGLVDADDLVQPYYLKETASYFCDPKVGFLQTFEGNRDYEGSDYYTACVDSFQSFYLSVMSSRNERDTVPFVGTMGLFRLSALAEVGGWNEWCICEDTEASLRVLKNGWSGLYIPRCFGRGVVPPSFAGMLTQRHRWCFGAMQILRLHWRSLMPWDKSSDNQMTGPQRRDYLMASIGWFRDLLMLAFSLVLVAITGLLATHSSFFLAPMDGSRSLLPLSLMIIVATCMMFTQCHWTSTSARRAVLSLGISLAVTFVIARGCIEGICRRDGVFLRTSKSGGRRGILTALRLTPVEFIFAIVLFACVGLLLDRAHTPWLLTFLVFTQACVYACAPAVAMWNVRAQRAEREQLRKRFIERRDRLRWRRRGIFARVPRMASTAISGLCVGGVASVFVFPVGLLQTAPMTRNVLSPQALPFSSGSEVFLAVDPTTTAAQPTYYPVSAVQVANVANPTGHGSTQLGLNFTTSSLPLLGEVLHAGTHGGRIPHISLVFRSPRQRRTQGADSVATYYGAMVTSINAQLSGSPAGQISLLLPSAGALTAASTAQQHIVGADSVSSTAVGLAASDAVARAFVRVGHNPKAYEVTGVTVSQGMTGGPISLSLSTSAPSLLQRIYRTNRSGTTIPTLRLSARAEKLGLGLLSRQFSHMDVAAFTENLSAPFYGSATFVSESKR